MFGEIAQAVMKRGLLFYIGCLLIPTPPSPCPDFGLQFLIVVAIGLIAPKRLISPIYLFFHWLGDTVKGILEKVPGVRIVVYKADELLQRWFNFVRKERHSDNFLVEKFYRTFLREDLVERLIFGYFVSIILGLCLMSISLFF